MLQGIIIKSLKTFLDERGLFTELFKSSWKDVFKDEILQANLSVSHPGIIRAWHKHERGQVDYFVTLFGTTKICVFDDSSKELDEIFSSGNSLQIVRVPGHYWHGFKVVGNDSVTLLYFVNKEYDPKKPDEVRKPWDDPEIIPLKINDKKDDPRCNKPWDWTTLPHK